MMFRFLKFEETQPPFLSYSRFVLVKQAYLCISKFSNLMREDCAGWEHKEERNK
jgi:hypothetical protein